MSDQPSGIPEWADEQLSAELPVLRSRGESQDIEYIMSFPDNTRELAKEIAAFGSSNPGLILLGVSDSGELIGLEGTNTPEGRDRILRRLEGICRGTVQPSITPSVSFALENGQVVLAIRVPRGPQPLYYSGHTPYVRHLTESRPAHPHEVVQCITDWLLARGFSLPSDIGEEDPEQDAISSFLSQLAVILRDILIYVDEVEERSISPALDILMSVFGYAASELQELASTTQAVQLDLSDNLRALQDVVDNVAHYRHTLGRESWEGFVSLVRAAADMAINIKEANIDTVQLSESTRSAVFDRFAQLVRQVEAVSERVDVMANEGRRSEIQEEAIRIGRSILELSYLGLDREDPALVEELRNIGHQLHLAESITFTIGGSELRQLMGTFIGAVVRLTAIHDQFINP